MEGLDRRVAEIRSRRDEVLRECRWEEAEAVAAEEVEAAELETLRVALLHAQAEETLAARASFDGAAAVIPFHREKKAPTPGGGVNLVDSVMSCY